MSHHLPPPPSLDEAIDDVTAWRRRRFPRSTVSSTMKHLKREIAELENDPGNPEEIADVLMLLIGLADLQHIDLAGALAAKLVVNKARPWGEPDAEGVVEHLRQKKQDPTA